MGRHRWNLKLNFRAGLLFLMVLSSVAAYAGVSRIIQEKYKRDYENKALFLKLPIYSEREYVYISASGFRMSSGSGQVRFKVGDQLRVLGLDFGGDEIKFKMAGIASAGLAEIIFKFDIGLLEDFPNQEIFNRALAATFTEGLKYSDLDNAKKGYVEDQFDQAIREIASTASLSREAVLKTVAPQVPAYADAQKEIEELTSRHQETTDQLHQAQIDNRRLESESKTQQSELVRLRTAQAALQEKMDSSAAQLSRLSDEVRSTRGLTQGYQKELANLQRSLNIKVDSSRDLAAQIADLGQAMRKLQKDAEAYANQIVSLQTSLESQQAISAKLAGETEDLKATNKQLQGTISALTSKEDSLARQYLDLKNAKDKLDDFAQTVSGLSSRIVEEETRDGVSSIKAIVSLKNVILGSIELRIPMRLSHGEAGTAEASFATESIDYVRVTPEERHILRSLGEKLKLRTSLASPTKSIEVRPENGDSLQEIGERDRVTWRWKLTNNGSQDSRLLFNFQFVNRNSVNIPLLQREQLVLSSSVVREIRGYLQPIPLSVGVLIGFLLFGIVGIFRRTRGPGSSHRDRAATATSSHSNMGSKQL
jgi:predicted nuclease with TOPRIM domain